MRSRPILWLLVSLLCLAGAFYLWRGGARPLSPREARLAAAAAQAANRPLVGKASHSTLVPPQATPGQTNMTPRQVAEAKRAKLLSYRLSNTTKPLKELLHDGRAVLLENALIDTGSSAKLAIPDSLRAHGDPGTYIVQATGPINAAFRTLLQNAGANVISYIPNNAYLVRASQATADELAGDPQTQSVLPYEPYYKLKAGLLESAVEQQPLPGGSALNVLLFADSSAATISQLESMGAQVMGQDSSPFGPVVKVVPAAGSLAAIISLSGVEEVELLHRRAPANDLSRVIMGISPDTTSGFTNDYLGLTGSGVIVNQNDTGVDAHHPDFDQAGNGPLRVFGAANALVDTNGHGTHVAGIIMGDGSASFMAGFKPFPVASGSSTNPPANFRGKAPLAQLYIQALDFNNEFFDDSALQEGAATNGAYISNNSWGAIDDNTYNIESASYDAAVRDALPGTTGMQPLVYVFAAANNGDGNADGEGGTPDTLVAPGTAKNVITVGATELPRFITNQFEVFGITNAYFYQETDSSNQVAFFSSCGNVGVGVEGDFGRFKPDVVAPGEFVVSTRSEEWNQAAYYDPTNIFPTEFFGISLTPGDVFEDVEFVPDNGVAFSVTIETNSTSPSPFPGLPFFYSESSPPNLAAAPPDVISPGVPVTVFFPPNINSDNYFYAIHNNTSQTVNFDLLFQLFTTNQDNALVTLSNLNTNLGSRYRYESGTSMATPAVSGTLALMQQFFEQYVPGHQRPSPAMLKALLINGARTLSDEYDFNTESSVNEQGWGMANLTNSIPASLTNFVSYTNSGKPEPIVLYDQSMTNTTGDSLSTGQSVTHYFAMNNAARNKPLRATLVWTDPPGNPAAGVKLVNSLQLIVTNMDSQEVFYGNDIGSGDIYNNSHDATDSNDVPVFDDINNVQNVYIQPTLDTHFSVTVVAQAVNVNAVTANSNNVAQDYALVITDGNGLTNCLITNLDGTAQAPATAGTILSAATWDITDVTNGIPLENQEVGADSPLYDTNTVGVPLGTIASPGGGQITIGATNQWHFYIFSNSVANPASFTNVAFATFEPPDLAVPREGVFEQADPENATRPEADIDLFVSTNPGLTNLDPVVLEQSVQSGMASLGQGGTEAVVLTTNDGPGTVFYIGVQSEDRMAAQYGFFGIAQASPFSAENANGSTLYGTPVPANIAVGNAKKPADTRLFFFEVNPTGSYLVQRVVVTNTITHQLLGDTLGNLSHNGQYVVLNNHTPGVAGFTNYTIVYDDMDDGLIPGSTNSDGPGSLRNFIGVQSAGVWIMDMVDNSPTETGQVASATVVLSREGNQNDLPDIPVGFGEIFAYDAPLNSTNVTISLAYPSGGPLELFVGDEFIPTLTNFDEMWTVPPPGGTNTIGSTNNPPYNPGDTYYVLVYNPPTGANVPGGTLDFIPGLSLTEAAEQNYTVSGAQNLFDDAVNNSTMNVSNAVADSTIVAVNVGVRINHPRISDLSLTLVSPDGTRVLLMENRGNGTTNGAGSSITYTNVFPLTTNGNFNVASNVLETGQTSGTLIVDYNFFTIPDDMKVYYDGNQIYDTGLINGTNEVQIPYGPGNSTEVTIVMNQGNNTNTSTEWEYTAEVVSSAFSYLTFTDDTNLASIPIKFAVPPFLAPTNTTMVYSDGFEAAVTNTYTTNQTFETFTVLTNEVTAVSDPYVAQGGNKYIALGDGSFTGNVGPTIAGRKYRMDLAYRGPGIVSWWRGESNALDSIGTNNGVLMSGVTFTQAVVGAGFQFNGTSYVNVPYSPTLDFTNEFSLETWFRDDAGTGSAYGLISRRACCSSPPCNYAINIGASGVGVYYEDVTLAGAGASTGSDDGSSQFQVSRYPVDPPAHVFHHLVGTYQQFDSDHIQITTFLDGQLVRQKLLEGNFTNCVSPQPLTLGTSSGPPSGEFMDGMMDEVSIYNRPLSLAEVSAIYEDGTNGIGKFDPQVIGASSLAKAQFSAGNGAPETFYGENTNWQTGTVFFTANSITTPIYAKGIEPGMLVDSLAVTELPSDIYYFPEEPLSKLKGESANGQWTLELWDNRVGAPAPAGALESWQLSFVFASGTEQPDVTNSVAPSTMSIIPVPVPCNATFATNILVSASAPVVVYYNLTQPPTGTNAGDVVMFGNVTSGIDPLPVPPIVPCTTYYVGIFNTQTTNVTYNFQVNFSYATATETSLGLAAGNPIPEIGKVTVNTSGVLLEWDGPTSQSYQVQSIPSLTKTNWNTYTNLISSATGHFSFLDNGSQTGGLGPVRFYRLMSASPTVTVGGITPGPQIPQIPVIPQH